MPINCTLTDDGEIHVHVDGASVAHFKELCQRGANSWWAAAPAEIRQFMDELQGIQGPTVTYFKDAVPAPGTYVRCLPDGREFLSYFDGRVWMTSPNGKPSSQVSKAQNLPWRLPQAGEVKK